MPPSGWLAAAGALLLIILCTVYVTLRVGRWWTRVTGGRRQRDGQRAEQRARKVLRKAGYEVVEEQPPGVAHVVIDGEHVEQVVHADYRVRDKRGRFWIAEVKSGALASATRDKTRRQLLEYSLLYEDVEGLLLVDMRDECIVTIRFDYE